MAQEEARQLIEDVDLILAHGAQEPRERERILKLRRQLEEVRRTGRFPEEPANTASSA